ncbi:MAG TPA: NAD-dependent epimerase/dehydratase, partial [Bacteroidales bacterium]|nr:NAD-dependent epimerase/dehydratase [Bacteroidales bacterium]
LAEYLLSKGHEVHGIIRRSSTFNTERINHIFDRLHLHYGDLTDGGNITSLVNNIMPDAIYNLSAQSHVKVSYEIPEYTCNVTGLGTLRILEAVRQNKELVHKTKIFQASSSEMFGWALPPQNEDTLMQPNSPYAIAKIAAIKMCSAFNKQYGTNFISAMPPNQYGYEDNFDAQNSHLIPALIRKFHEAKIFNLPSVTLWGDGSPRREFMFADDLADGLIFLMSNYDYNGDDFINIGSGYDLTIAEIAYLIQDIVGYRGDVVWDLTKPNGTMLKLLDSSKINSLGWKPKTSLSDGLINTYKWFEDNYPNIKGIREIKEDITAYENL